MAKATPKLEQRKDSKTGLVRKNDVSILIDFSFDGKRIWIQTGEKIDVNTVGASGAVFGVLLAFGMLFPNTILYVYFALPIKAKYFVALYGFFELYSGFENTPGDNVAHFAHLGGMLFGFILIKIWSKYNRKNFY